ncbi:MAG: sulfatase [Polyangiaceae bacterium]
MGLLAGCTPGTEPAPRPNVLFIVADTLRADHLGLYGSRHDTSPNLDAFGRANLTFLRPVSPAPWTSPAVASLFTSLYPSAHGVVSPAVGSGMPNDSLAESYTTLAEQFSSAGYATRALIANPWVSRLRGYAQGFDSFVDVAVLLEQGNATPTTDELRRMATDELRRLKAEGQPFFFYLHFLDPHSPFSAPSELVDRFHPQGAKRPKKPNNLGKISEQVAQYNAEIFVLDEAIGELFAFLRAEGLYDDLIIAFTSDHGEQFWEHGQFGHGHTVYSEEVYVPFLLKARGQKGEVAEVVSTLDVGPTLLAAAGLERLPNSQGVPLPSDLHVRKERGALTEATMKRNFKALVTELGEKWVVEFNAPANELVDESKERAVIGFYEWGNDGKGKEVPIDASRTQALRTQFYEQLAESAMLRDDAEAAPVKLDAGTIEALKALGYGEMGEASGTSPGD